MPSSSGAGSKQESTLSQLKQIDLLGFSLLSSSVVMLLLALQWGGTVFPWNGSTVIGLFCGSFGTILVFAFWQWKMQDRACIPPKTFFQRTVAFGFLVAVFGNGGFHAIVYYIPIWFQAVKGASPLSSGVMYLPTVISDLLTAVIAGVLSKSESARLTCLKLLTKDAKVSKLPYYNPFLVFGLIILTVGAGLDTTLNAGSDKGRWIGYQILCGVGFALLVQVVRVRSLTFF